MFYLLTTLSIIVASNITILNSYNKGASNIRGEFLLSTDDPNDCYTGGTTTTTNSDEFISEDIVVGGNGGGTMDCTGCGTSTVEASNGYCAFKSGNTGYSNILGYSDQLIINLNDTGAYATPAPSLASYRSTNYCKFKTKTINQIGPGSDITVTSTFISNNTIQTTANGTISYIADNFGTIIVYTAVLKKINSTYYWDFSISCGQPPQTNTILNYAATGSAYTPDFTGMIPAGGGGYGNLLPYSACGSTVATQGITAGGTAIITLSDPVYL
jgi:hypothetical protein